MKSWRSGEVIKHLNREQDLTVLVEQKRPFARRVASDFHILEKDRPVVEGRFKDLNDRVAQDHPGV